MKRFWKIMAGFALLFALIGVTSAGPGAYSTSRQVVYEVIADSTIDGFVDDLISNADTNSYYMITAIEMEIDTGTAFTSASSADTVKIFTRTDSDTTVVATVLDAYLISTLDFSVQLAVSEYKTSGVQFWIESPASEYTLGTRNYTLRVYYVIRQKYY